MNLFFDLFVDTLAEMLRGAGADAVLVWEAAMREPSLIARLAAIS